jgi:hypothetical protein
MDATWVGQMDASTAGQSVVRSDVRSVASLDMMWVGQMDERLAASRVDLKESMLAGRLVIASVVWTAVTMVAWSVYR